MSKLNKTVLEANIEKALDIPFKEFMPGQVIQSSQFNDDMLDIEDKVNEIINKHNSNVNVVYEHLNDVNNPHQVNPHQIGTYESTEIDGFIADVKNGNLNDESITNRVLADACVDNRVLVDGVVTLSKLDTNIGNQIDISNNMSIKERYTKLETDAIIQEKVGDGTYSKEQIDAKFEEYQAGTIVDGTIDVSKLKDSVGRQLDITNNPSISNRYTKTEVDTLIAKNGLPKDWGGLNDSIEDDDNIAAPTLLGHLPISDVMVCGEFKTSETDVLNVKVQDVEFAKGEFSTLEGRLDDVDNRIDSNVDEINKLKELQSAFNDKLLNNNSGYYVLPNGLTIQWGSLIVFFDGLSMVDTYVEFPKALTTFVQPFCNCSYINSDEASSIITSCVASLNGISVRARHFQDMPLAYPNNLTLNWFAIGM